MKITYSNRRTLALCINRQGEPEVRAPYGCPKAVIEQFIEKNQGWIERRLQEQAAQKQYTPQEMEALRKKAKEYLPPRVAYYAALMGVTPTALKITSARTRYGSCSGKNSINFSLFLMEKSPRAIDYVVVQK